MPTKLPRTSHFPDNLPANLEVQDTCPAVWTGQKLYDKRPADYAKCVQMLTAGATIKQVAKACKISAKGFNCPIMSSKMTRFAKKTKFSICIRILEAFIALVESSRFSMSHRALYISTTYTLNFVIAANLSICLVSQQFLSLIDDLAWWSRTFCRFSYLLNGECKMLKFHYLKSNSPLEFTRWKNSVCTV